MKKWKFIGGLIMGLLALTIIIVGCKDMPWHGTDNYDTAVEDTICVASMVEDYLNPQFSTVNELVQFRKEVVEEYEIDSIFCSLPEATLKNVASVLIRKYGIVDKRSVVEEYRANISVYDNLPTTQQTTTKPVDLGATDLGNRQDEGIISTSYQYRTDTIDDKPVKIQIKTEESYAD